MKKLIGIVSALFVVINIGYSQNRVMIDQVVGKVGSEIILLSDIEEQYALMSAQQGVSDPNAKCYLLDQLLAQRLMLNQARLDSLVIADEEVESQLDARIERILSYMNNDVSQFEAYYGQSIAEVREEFRTDLKNQITVERMQGQIMNSVKITPSEVKDFFASIPVDSLPYFNSEVELGEIVYLPKVNEEEREKARLKLEDIRSRIVDDGESFEELASIFSDDPGSGRAGGDLGWATRNTFVPEFEATAYGLENGEIAELVETEFGFHLIQLLERRGNTIHARHILVKPEITSADYELAYNTLDSIRNEIEIDSLSFSAAVKRHSDDKQQSYNNDGNMVNPKSGNTFFEIGELDPDVYFAIDTLEVGEISSPIEFQLPTGEKAYRLVVVKSRTKPHKANLQQDYSKIQKAALESKKTVFINDWVNERIENTFIQVDDRYNTCPNLENWQKAEKNSYP